MAAQSTEGRSSGAVCRWIPRPLHSARLALTLVCWPLQIGLLYLRYVGEPKSLWQDWLSHYMYDDQVRQSESLGAAIGMSPVSSSDKTPYQ